MLSGLDATRRLAVETKPRTDTRSPGALPYVRSSGAPLLSRPGDRARFDPLPAHEALRSRVTPMGCILAALGRYRSPH